ncbi:MAG: sigma-70 family RNA polymerase sigma factor [Betaproteobacteria bacterium]
MSTGGDHRARPLTLVPGSASSGERSDDPERRIPDAPVRGLDWSILMAHAQAGEQDAYKRLLQEIAPYVHSLAKKCHRNPSDVEDSVQDVLLTVHAVRHTYDPTRPFGPWLVAIANRRITDRLRRQGRTTARETTLTTEHETFAAPEANYHESMSDARALQKAIERLPQGQRDAIKLLKLQEMSLKETATVSGMSVAALKVATHRAIKSLRKILVKPHNDT